MKKAFTMLELIFVIVIIGILAAVIIPNTRSNPTAEAATKLMAHLRYTQHLALIDDKYDGTANAFRDRWQVRFTGDTYSIVNDNNTSYATSPSDRQTPMKDIDLNKDYGVTVTFQGTQCLGQSIISFDYLGRPFVGDLSANANPYDSLMTNADCEIEISYGAETATVAIQPETGYASVSF